MRIFSNEKNGIMIMKNTFEKVTSAVVLLMVSASTFASACGRDQVCTEVPEPGGLALMGVGIAAIAASKYYKSRNK